MDSDVAAIKEIFSRPNNLESNEKNLHGEVVGRSLGRGLASNETAPCFVALVDNFSGILLVLGFAREREGVFGLSIGNLVDPEGQTDR